MREGVRGRMRREAFDRDGIDTECQDECHFYVKDRIGEEEVQAGECEKDARHDDAEEAPGDDAVQGTDEAGGKRVAYAPDPLEGQLIGIEDDNEGTADEEYVQYENHRCCSLYYTTHMTAPLLSTLTLLAEIGVTACVYYVIWRAYTKGEFVRWLAFGVLAYEIIFNISYMLSRIFGHVEEAAPDMPSSAATALAIFHGIFSLIMFVAIIVFFVLAARGYARGDNFFRTHRSITSTFALAWMVAILSGLVFYFVLYF